MWMHSRPWRSEIVLSSYLLTELKPSRLHCVLMRRIDLTTHFHQCQRLDIKMLSGHTDDNNSPREIEGERERAREMLSAALTVCYWCLVSLSPDWLQIRTMAISSTISSPKPPPPSPSPLPPLPLQACDMCYTLCTLSLGQISLFLSWPVAAASACFQAVSLWEAGRSPSSSLSRRPISCEPPPLSQARQGALELYLDDIEVNPAEQPSSVWSSSALKGMFKSRLLLRVSELQVQTRGGGASRSTSLSPRRQRGRGLSQPHPLQSLQLLGNMEIAANLCLFSHSTNIPCPDWAGPRKRRWVLKWFLVAVSFWALLL